MENIKIWLKKNLFSNWYYSLITIFILYVLFSTIPTFLDWAFFKATFIGNTKSDCKSGGACWVFIKVWFDKLIYGFYPEKDLWRVNLTFLILIFSGQSVGRAEHHHEIWFGVGGRQHGPSEALLGSGGVHAAGRLVRAKSFDDTGKTCTTIGFRAHDDLDPTALVTQRLVDHRLEARKHRAVDGDRARRHGDQGQPPHTLSLERLDEIPDTTIPLPLIEIRPVVQRATCNNDVGERFFGCHGRTEGPAQACLHAFFGA